jgi:hypothetical protein
MTESPRVGVLGATSLVGRCLLVVLQSRAAWLGLAVAAVIGGATILRHRRQLAASPAVQRGVTAGLLGCLAAMALIEAERFAEAIAVIEDVPEPLRTEGMQEALAVARERGG